MSAPLSNPDTLDVKQIRAEKVSLDADPSLPPTRVWAVRLELSSLVYPNISRYYVQRWESVKVSWISPNSAAPGMPEPPSEDGPGACGCTGATGHPEAVYGHMESERLWHSRADWYDEEKPERAFAPDVWRGLGPCPAASFNSVLHQFPAYVRDARAGRPWFRIEDTARREMENAESLDMDVLPWLFPEDAGRKPPSVPRLVFEGAPSIKPLHARWAVWAVYVLKKRAFVGQEMVAANAVRAALAGNAVGFDRMRRAYYFGYNAVGAWFDRTPEQVGVIRHYISLGIPVFYRWELQYATKQNLADLRPSQGPDEGVSSMLPPSSPSCAVGPVSSRSAVVVSAPALLLPIAAPSDPELHWSSARRVPGDAVDEYGYTLEEAEDTLNWFDQQEAERAAAPLSRSSPAPSSAPSQATSAASRAPPSSAASRASPAPAPGLDVFKPAWSHASLSRTDRVPLHRRISPLLTGVDWFSVSNALEYFEQKDEYKLSSDGKQLEGLGYAVSVDWHARLLGPYWLPDSFKARRSSRSQSQLEQVEMVFRYGIAFQTVIPDWIPSTPLLPSPVDGFGFREAYLRAHAHSSSDILNLVDGNPVSSFVENWAAAVSLFCQRPHARAALLAGGLIARIARWGGLSLADALKGPSDDVRNWGTPYPIEELVEKEVVLMMDDWLEPLEVATLHGRMQCPSPKFLALWPDPSQFRRNWFNERGTWTFAMEIWFVDCLEKLWKNRKKPDLKTRAQWREEIRERKREEDTALALHG